MLFVKIYLTVILIAFICTLLFTGLDIKYNYSGVWGKLASICAWTTMILGGLFLVVVALNEIWHF